MSHHPLALSISRRSSNETIDDEDDLVISTGSQPPPPPSLCGIPLKYLSLVTLALQNSMLAIIMYYSRISTAPALAYSTTTAVLMNEILKGSISLVIAFFRIDHPSRSIDEQPSLFGSLNFIYRSRRLLKEVFSPDCWKLSIPAILYVIQNNLQFVAMDNLNPATFQVSYQMKILTTAAFSVILLRKKLSPAQWIALLFLTIGVGVVQIQLGTGGKAPVPASDTTPPPPHDMNQLKGMAAVLAACCTSGLAGVYFEMVLKNSNADLWVRNVQLSLFSLLPALSPILFAYFTSSPESRRFLGSVFDNFGGWAWATVCTQVLGGLLTALVIKYSDNILKGFATSLSIVISFLASVALFNFHITFTFILGSGIVVAATWLYNQPQRAPLRAEDVALMKNLLWRDKPPQTPALANDDFDELDEARPLSRSLSVLHPLSQVNSTANSSSHSLSESWDNSEK